MIKNIILLLIIFSFNEVPKEYQKMNMLIISIDDREEAYKKLLESMYTNGFTIEKYDTESGIFNTEPRDARYGAETMIKGRIFQDKIEMQYFTRIDITIYGVRSNSWDIQNFKGGSKGSYIRTAFDLFMRVNSVFEGERTYLQK